MLYTKCGSKLFYSAERGDEGIRIGIGHLQAHTEHHREDKEERHFLLFEERKRFESKGLNEIYVSFGFLNLASRKGERVDGEQDTQTSANYKLPRRSLETSKSMHHIVAMKPTVPKTRIGGKSLTVSMFALTSALNATELVSAIVGMKNATEKV